MSRGERKRLKIWVEGPDDVAVLRAVLKRVLSFKVSLPPGGWEVEKHIPPSQLASYEGVETAVRSRQEFDYVLLLVDFVGSGKEKGYRSRSTWQGALPKMLYQRGLGERAKYIVIAPELEIWLWRDEETLARKLGLTPMALQQLEERGECERGHKPS